MFLDLDKKDSLSTAIVDGQGHTLSYGELLAFHSRFYRQIGRRTLLFILCENGAGALAGYTAALDSRVVPLMLSAGMDKELLSALIKSYHPAFLWLPKAMQQDFPYPSVFSELGYTLLQTGLTPCPMYEELSLLLTTSGSTGSPKFVRHSYQNVEANARNVAAVFEMNPAERGMVSLPLQFTQGLNVASSHLFAGGSALLTTANLTQKEFWSFFREQRATSFTGVPYSYELLDKLRFFRMDLPDLKTINQGGGRLTSELFQKCAQYAKDTGRRFMPSYGSTETTSRMACLPAELAMEKCGSIGRPLPNCSITLVEEDGREITGPNETGEIVFRGPNVTLGYAECGEDLIKGDERHGVFATGDLAYRDEDGCYFIIGRKKRFLKLFGYRVGLDETERLIKGAFPGIECACTGSDKKMLVFTTSPDMQEKLLEFLSGKTGINRSAFEIHQVDSIPKNDAGKTLYEKLRAQI